MANVTLKYFKAHEFSDFSKMDPELLRRLDKAREIAGIPFKITSSYRSPAYNASVGGVANSSHTKGLAVDISCTDSRQRFLMLKALIEVGFNRIELAPTWLHVDMDTTKDANVAFYQKGGRY